MAAIVNEEWWQGVIHNTNKFLSFACLPLIQFTVYIRFIILHQDFVCLFPVHNCITFELVILMHL